MVFVYLNVVCVQRKWQEALMLINKEQISINVNLSTNMPPAGERESVEI